MEKNRTQVALNPVEYFQSVIIGHSFKKSPEKVLNAYTLLHHMCTFVGCMNYSNFLRNLFWVYYKPQSKTRNTSQCM